MDSEIKQISVAGDGITVVNFKGTNNKTVKLTDVAIGDFIVAMGYINSKSVLSAQRILITDPVEEPKIDSVLGNVTDTSKQSVTITSPKDGQTQNVIPGTKTAIRSFDSGNITVLKFSGIAEGDLIIVITDSSGTTPTVRSIFRVQKAQT